MKLAERAQSIRLTMPLHRGRFITIIEITEPREPGRCALGRQ
jgi:hypothetical protein